MVDHAIIAIKQILSTSKYQFYSYTPSADKIHAFILKGLDQAPEPEEVEDALINDYKILVKQVRRLSSQKIIYLVVTPKNYTVTWLNKHAKI
ncbi:hypothetical protein JTB14_035802 [Gonioctena quinquepunctata]|nr:hypothetical protein JTB14_035802 [Gonioctena quinquepunctata]